MCNQKIFNLHISKNIVKTRISDKFGTYGKFYDLSDSDYQLPRVELSIFSTGGFT